MSLNKEKKLYIGLMSGTSMDGIDAALVDLNSNQFIAGLTLPYSSKTKLLLLEILAEEKQSLRLLSQLNTVIGREFAEAVLQLLKNLNLSSCDIQAIGSHGQTICHEPDADIPYTIQLGCAHSIAELTGITVVADFRTRDLVLGGKGAPFAPLYHHALFKEKPLPLVVVNIGGIANLSYLACNDNPRGYDTGPGNCLMDAWVKEQLGKDYDENGLFAASGQVIEELLIALLQDPFFSKRCPKSIGKEYFSKAWLKQHLKLSYKPADVQATLLQLTAKTIASAIIALAANLKTVLVCGGGVHNLSLMQAIKQLLPHLTVQSTSSCALDPDYIEAAMFAFLAEKTLSRTALNLNSITGAKRAAILGTIYLASGH